MAEPVSWPIQPISVQVPPGQRRNPIAIVRMRIGPFVMSLGVSRLRKSGIAVRWPVGEDKLPAIEADPEVRGAIQKAAFAAVIDDPMVCEHLFGPDRRHLHRFLERKLREMGVIVP